MMNQTSAHSNAEDGSTVAKRNSRKTALIAAMSVLGLALVGGGIYAWSQQANDGENAAAQGDSQTSETALVAANEGSVCDMVGHKPFTSNTSPGFAEQVFNDFVTACEAENKVSVMFESESQITGTSIEMACKEYDEGVLCTGDQNVEVYIW
ncbi:hypothetical protein [Corynebacterium aquatimens]|uniref:Uncharacterized protein n=1 Tax=Corynebacterium aquatimens TaxID=1190508 RepID=A0A931DTG4_9CORY|nr:hypothetical protein [Corynebacterium aquatimens]MBG6121119.1 hypothetical protein [Corynebacterium aquatimens]WJY66325.1 hypothetical protein CAQUA_08155 [Corynebacterium aquatimens]